MSIFSAISSITAKAKAKSRFKDFNKKLNHEIKTSQIHKFELDKMADNAITALYESHSVDKPLASYFIADYVLNKYYGINFFPSQKEAAYYLSQGLFVEMDTGEGKTLAFALAAATHAAGTGKKVTIATANDYLVERDYKYTEQFFNKLGIKSAFINSKSNKEQRQEAYLADVLYTTMRETSYDYLRNNQALSLSEVTEVIRDLLLVDEADNVLIDNATSPYIISEDIEVDERLIVAACDFAKQSKASTDGEENYIFEDDKQSISLSQKGSEALEDFLVKYNFIEAKEDLYQPNNLHIFETFRSAGVALFLMKEGTHYLKQDGKILVLDKASGRVLSGVSLSNSLQQVLEQYSGYNLSNEFLATGSITTESISGLFSQVAGMSGTLKEEEDELLSTYGKGCVSLHNKNECKREDKGDVFFISDKEKIRFIIEEVLAAYKTGQPVLLCAKDEGQANGFYKALTELKVNSNLITSQTLEDEAFMVAQAGMPHKVTISTGNAGRGTDIILGGNKDEILKSRYLSDEQKEDYVNKRDELVQKAKDSGGLYVISSGRQPTRKRDLQLVGRSGRQGDVGKSIFVNSIADVGLESQAEKLTKFLSMLSIKEDDMLSHDSITKALNNVQREHRQSILQSRKANGMLSAQLESQRRALFDLRKSLLMSDDIDATINSLLGLNVSGKSKEEVLKAHDDAIYSYYSNIQDLSKSIFLQTYAGKSPAQELKKKAFAEYELFLKHFVNNIEH